MLDWFYQVQLWSAVAAGLFCLILAIIARPPSGYSVLALAVVEAGLLFQLVIGIVLVAQGQSAARDTLEYFGYLIVALLVPAGAVLWALLERSRWSTFVLAGGALTVAVMLVRMSQLWFG